MKSLRIWSVFLIVVLLLPLIEACGDDDSNSNNKSNVLDKHISTVEYFNKDRNQTIIYNLHYASNGNILSINRKRKDGVNINPNTYPYEYLDNMIVMHPYFNDDIKYILLNNRLVSIEDKYDGQDVNFSYDDNNFLLSCVVRHQRYNEATSVSYTWSNGNIIKMEINGETIIDVDYTSHIWPTNYIMPFEYLAVSSSALYVPGVFMAMGYCGNRPKYLPKRIGEIEYDYIMENGYPVTIKVGDNEYKYTWN